MASGVPRGAISTSQPIALKPGTSSAAVGSAGPDKIALAEGEELGSNILGTLIATLWRMVPFVDQQS
jgi:hypothetical protein